MKVGLSFNVTFNTPPSFFLMKYKYLNWIKNGSNLVVNNLLRMEYQLVECDFIPFSSFYLETDVLGIYVPSSRFYKSDHFF